MNDQLKDPISGKVISAAIEVHRQLGRGLDAKFYKVALFKEMKLRSVDCMMDKESDVLYKGDAIGKQTFDLLVDDLVVSVKNSQETVDIFIPEIRSKIKAANRTTALILNFGHSRMLDGVKRVMIKQNYGD
ncbi:MULTISPECIES: GxxExxY protein [unclassified Fusibacter]|uniref:GxxExxY protein n=1 Tax=unclassified Fusibacter TaxID=2624464 RepID=UPI0010115E5B|nr:MULTISPECIES: GxxExxY protein [unclassified Fusibacter]MCK8060418.1 GxxExxY protein [Fusibacter sp. A2]NPE20293.1 GxxExxY protein [Fusibacter sp. A1]RXV63499.1 GxxExxY protein [Fusibacter sp. A1]